MTDSSVGYCGRLEAGYQGYFAVHNGYSCWGVLSAAAVVFTPSPTVASQFQLGTLGRNNCPARYYRIIALSVCETAAAFLGMPFGGSEWTRQYPNGCYMVGSVYFNTFPHDDSDRVEASSYQLLCASGAPHARACMQVRLCIS